MSHNFLCSVIDFWGEEWLKSENVNALLLPVFCRSTRFLLVPKTEKSGRAVYYYADFKYIKNGKIIYEDVKGVQTDVYKLKKKLLMWIYPNICFYENKV